MTLKVTVVFSALRVFALWDRNIPMMLLVLALNLVPVAADIVSHLFRVALCMMFSRWLVHAQPYNRCLYCRPIIRHVLQ